MAITKHGNQRPRTDDVLLKKLPPGVKLLRTLEGHTEAVMSFAFDPEGHMLASGSKDKTVRLWDLHSGKVLRTLNGHSDGVWSVAFDPQDRTLASGSADHTVRLWEPQSGNLLRTLEGHSDAVDSVAFDPQGNTLASGSGDHTVRLWEPRTGKLLRTLEGHTDSVFSVAFDPRGNTLATGSYDRTVRLWEPQSGKLLRTLERNTDYVRCVACDPQGQTLASGGIDKVVRLWELQSGTLLRTLEGHTGCMDALAFSHDGALLASKSTDRTVRLWRCDTWELVAVLPERTHHTWWLPALAFHPTQSVLATGGSYPDTPDDERGRLIHLWKLDFATLLGRTRRAAPVSHSYRAASVIKAKEKEGKFDVFLSHNSKDKAAVEKIARRLPSVGIRPWLDNWNLSPGDTIMDVLEDAIKTIPCAVLCFGPADQGDWHIMEIRAYVAKWAKNKARMIPVILPGAPAEPEVPLFVHQTLWVNMREWEKEKDDSFYRLVCGILGRAPGDSPMTEFGIRQVVEWQGGAALGT